MARFQRRWWHSLRVKFVLTLLIALVPIAGLLTFLWFGARARDRDDSLDSLTQTAEAFAVIVDDLFDEAISLSQAISTDPAIRRLDPVRTTERLHDLRLLYPKLGNVVVVDASGDLVGWSSPEPAAQSTPPVENWDLLAQAITSDRPLVIGAAHIPDTDETQTSVAVPIFGPDGATVGLIATQIDLDRVRRQLAGARPHPGQAFSVIDASGRLVLALTDTGASERTLTWEQRDRSMLPEVQSALHGQSATSTTFRGPLTGQDRLAAFVPTARHGWVVGATWTVESALGPTRVAQQREILTFATIVLILCVGALTTARSLVGPLSKLAEHARRFGAGHFEPVTGVDGSDEIGALAATFNEMGKRLELSLHELRQRDELLGVLVDQFPGGISVVDRDLRFVLFGGRRVLREVAPGEAIVGRSIAEVLPSEAFQVYAARAEEAAAGATVSFDLPAGPRVLQMTVAPLRDVGGTVIHLLNLAFDVTDERDRLERAGRDEKLRALGQMAGGIAHDLNQALTLVAGYGELAGEALNADALDRTELREMVRIVAQAAYDGGETVKRLLLFARGEGTEHPEEIDVAVLLHEVRQLTAPRWRDTARAESRPVDLRVDVTPERPGSVGPTIVGSRPALREALTNLVFNALDAMPDGGTIVLAARKEDERVAIQVSDTGDGMSPEVRARVFEPFFTTKGERGTGLGLPMVFGIVQRHGGEIDVDSAPGQGTTIRLSFPFGTLEAGPAVATDRPLAGGLRILVVDDEPQLARLLAGMLERDGHRPVVASSGREALERLRAGGLDLVISDLSMGEGMNGWDLAEAAHRERPEVPVVLATGWGAGIDDEEARRRHVRVVVAKPFRVAAIRAAVAQATSAPTPASQSHNTPPQQM